jgi:enamine deaminase RidA (YjgF/YER057c/UK114 family)
MSRQLISTGTIWEREVGYSRAVRVGSRVYVAGTTASDDNSQVVGIGDVYTQTRYIFEKIERALHEAGATLNDVVRVRMFVRDIGGWESIGRAHGEFFRDIRPASTMVEISRLINPDHLIEIEVDAEIDG